MPQPGLSAAVGRARRAALGSAPEDRSDGKLLGEFLATQDAGAFAELVARFAPMVFAVCRRVTGHHQDAEDAFQAAFVVLARKAACVSPREAVGSWLYGVAVRTAREARTVAAKRLAREVPAARPPAVARPEPEPDELGEVLHEELARLPDKFRTLLVLCDMEGRPQVEVAGRLGLPAGTVYSRLAAARKALADRLRKRGVALSAGGLAAWLASAARAAVPDSLSAKAVAAAVSPGPVPAAVAALTHGVLRAMFIQKLNLVAVGGLLLAFACLAAWAATPQTAARETPTPTGAPVVFNQKPADDKKPAPAAKPAGPGKLLMMMDGRLLQYDP